MYNEPKSARKGVPGLGIDRLGKVSHAKICTTKIRQPVTSTTDLGGRQ